MSVYGSADQHPYEVRWAVWTKPIAAASCWDKITWFFPERHSMLTATLELQLHPRYQRADKMAKGQFIRLVVSPGKLQNSKQVAMFVERSLICTDGN